METLFRFVPGVSWSLSNRNPLRSLWLLTQLYCFCVSRKMFPQLKSREYILKGVFCNKSLTFYLHFPMDLAMLHEVFVDEEYEKVGDNDPKVIFDLGAHFGDTALYYNARFPEATIIAVEPDPDTFLRLEQHVRDIPQIVAVQAAVGAQDGEVPLYRGEASFGHSTIGREGQADAGTVRQVSLATLLRQAGVDRADIIKFDIEGAEFDLFQNITPAEYADFYIGEVHGELARNNALVEFSSLFATFICEQAVTLSSKRYIFVATK